MRAWILLVGSYSALLHSRAQLLREWETTVTNTEIAPDLLRNIPYDVLVLCQTVPDDIAQQLVDSACKLNPEIKVLAFSKSGQIRRLGESIRRHVSLDHPKLLRDAVANLLTSNQSGCTNGVVEVSPI